MSIYYLPATFCEHLECIMNQYWWGSHGSGGGGIRWMSCSRMCCSKMKGGLGYKHLNRFNIALLAKQGWRLLTNPSSLAARLYKARYYPHADFLDAKIGANPSYCWHSIMASQDILRAGCFKRIGNGEATLVWKHPWLPDSEDPYVHTACSDQNVNMRVSALINQNTKDWGLGHSP
ncbi:uncharacterized protein LOC116023389 [Ipomoea triloba]|uniref:uncharacterized protein LOC116023389 n=1 Tax=Ipomoea triloba TaxID=35885 RepID=UPI00125D13F4|nr:uncharacterized protein LOC116023389 [Ipomoea triloba]